MFHSISVLVDFSSSNRKSIENPSPGAGTDVLEAAGEGNVLCVVEGLVWWLCWAG